MNNSSLYHYKKNVKADINQFIGCPGQYLTLFMSS